jgi:octaprenyl-diphosphate synthase
LIKFFLVAIFLFDCTNENAYILLMNPLLHQIRACLHSDLAEYDRTLAQIMSSNVALVDKVAKYLVRHRGKGLRPLLVIICARMVGEPNKNTYLVAALVEILHTATLVHDDVIDEAEVRRSFPSINALWRNKISILMGDYLLAKSLISATATGSLEIMEILAHTAKRLSKGELLQIEKSRKMDISEQEYYRIVSDKTAALLSACCELGCLTARDIREDRQALARYGENIGIAFQIKDDLLDFEGKENILGKHVGADLKGKKITLPLIVSLNNAPGREKNFILKMLKKGVTNDDIKKIISFCEQYGGIRQAYQTAKDYAEKAKQSIASFPDNTYKDNAIKFVDYVISRKK